MTPTTLTRRDFLKVGASAAGGLLVGFHWPALSTEPAHEPVAGVALNFFVEIAPDGSVTIVAPAPEIGQGVRTALPMIVAEELSVSWSSVRVVQAEADSKYGGMSVGGSDSVADYWEPLRQAGALARELLVRAAAQEWGVDPGTCFAEEGQVVHRPSRRKLPYGRLASVAATLPPPESVEFKDPSSYRIIGKRTPRVDLREIVTGTATYGFDVEIPGMLYAVVARCPVQGGRPAEFDSSEALKVPGVRKVVQVKSVGASDRYGSTRGGVAVLAENSWAAIIGREALRITWDEGPNAQDSSSKVHERFLKLKDQPGQKIIRNQGDVASAFQAAPQRVQAEYELPLLAHACMEPMCFTAHARKGRCETWGPVQDPLSLQQLLAALFRLPVEAVEVHITHEGGGFGRRLAFDYGVEAAVVSWVAGAPVKVLWTREDDIQHDYYRTPSYHRLRAGLDSQGGVASWQHHVLTSPLRVHAMGPGVDFPELYDMEGAANVPYGIPNLRVEYSPVDVGLQLGSWRSVSHSFNVFAVESFLDEIAAARRLDPLELRRRLLGEGCEVQLKLPLPGRRGRPSWDTGRLRRVLDTVAEKAGWGRRLPPGWGQGIACCYFKRTYAAHVAEVSVENGGRVRVHRVVAAIDCGRGINPDGIEAQVEGSAMDAVATVLNWEITYDRGRVEQSNFHDYPLLRLAEAPAVEVHILASDEPPSGTGEPPYPSAVPAITNAIFAATGRRLRRLPIRPEESSR